MSTTAPDVQVLIGFAANPVLGDFFVLNDPVMGVLDNATYTLGGTVFVDVTQWCSGQIQTTRGRSRGTDQYQCGTASFTLRNEDRRFDPANTSSPYSPGISPRLPVIINLREYGETSPYDFQPIFTGYTDDVQVNYEIPNICTVSVTCLDAFTLLANSYLNNFSSPAGLSGAAVQAVLAAVGFPATASIDAGLTTVQASTQNNVSALSFLQSLAASENGDLFVDKYGTLTFAQRDRRPTNGYFYLSDDPAVIGMYGSGCGYQAITMASQSTLLYNRVTATRTGGTQQQADDAGSQASYHIRQLQLSQLENATDADVLSLCQYLVALYSQPEVRFSSVTVEMQSTIGYWRYYLIFMDLAETLYVERTPPGSGTPSKISILSVVEGISWTLDVSASTYRVTYNLARADREVLFVLDDSTYGVLDSNRLTY